MLAVRRWLFMTCALYVLCPRRVHVNADFWNYFKSDPNKKPGVDVSNVHVNLLSNVMTHHSDQTSATATLGDVEPGFDFTEDEIKKLKIWPGGVIPYYIDEFSFDKVFRDRLRAFFEATNGLTGLNFLELYRPPEDENSRWVFFVNRQGLLPCVDHPFKNFTNEGVQKVVLGYDCQINGGELAGLVLALVGVPPQHNAPNRNKYIEIVNENIMPGKAYLFETMRDNEWLFHEVNYDFSSAGHYSLHKYTKNGMATIKPLQSIDIAVGEGSGYSYTDIWKIRMLYNYISNNGPNTMTFPKCNKLFNPGPNFNNYKPGPTDEVEPRKKPNKYLGLPEDTPEAPDSSHKIGQANGKYIPAPQSSIQVLEEDKENTHERDFNNEESDSTKKLAHGKKRKYRNKMKGSNDNALTLMTDYLTEEEMTGNKIKEFKNSRKYEGDHKQSNRGK